MKGKSQVIKPGEKAQVVKNNVTIFLAGSIELGVAEMWQDKVIEKLKDFSVTFFNPRRDDWDSSWEQKESNPEFNYQVNWELDHLEEADFIFLYFDPKTKSPISLLEFGKHSTDTNLIVCCPDGFYRKGNIEIVCSRYNIPLYNDLESAIGSLRTKLSVIFN
jgi:hypothetical protein